MYASIQKRAAYVPKKTRDTTGRGCGILKFIGCLVLLVGCVGVLMVAFEENKRMMQREMMQLRTTMMEKNSRLENRVRRSAPHHAYPQEESEELVKERSKRSPGDLDSTPSLASGVTYTRWGRRGCSGRDNVLIYRGIAAGSFYSNTGGVTNHLCLHINVSYEGDQYQNGGQSTSYIAGLEFRNTNAYMQRFFNMSLTGGEELQYHSVPCAVCLARARGNQLMIPGQETCPDGWFVEYTGYVMSGAHSDKHGSTALCVDDTPQVVPGTTGSQGGAYLFMVETSCVSLLCEPFVSYRELRCVVCTI